MNSWWDIILIEPSRTVLTQVSQFFVNLVLFLLILLVGWLISKVVKVATTRLFRMFQLDIIAEKIELDKLLEKGGIQFSLSELLGGIFYWLALLVTFIVAANAIQLTIAADLLNRVVLYVPNIIVGIFVLVLGMFVATILKNIVLTAANNAGISQGNLLSKIVEVIIVIFTLSISLDQIGIGQRIIELTISIVLGSLGFAFALAFGFGCQDLAKKFVSDLIEKLKVK